MNEHAMALCRGKKMTVYQLCVTALMAAVMCILGPASIPIGEIPVTLTNLVIYLAVYLLGVKFGTLSCLVYLLLGLAGLPVFSGYAGGLAKFAGPTGGYLVGFLFMAFISGLFIEKHTHNQLWCITGMIFGSVVMYLFGTVWYVVLTKCSFGTALAVCVLPFLIGDLLKIVIAAFVGRQLRRRLIQADLIR